MTEDEMVGWYRQLSGHDFEQTLGDGEGQGSLVCCHPWGCKDSDTTELLNHNNKWKMISVTKLYVPKPILVFITIDK